MKYTKPELKLLELKGSKGARCSAGTNACGTVGLTAGSCNPTGTIY